MGETPALMRSGIRDWRQFHRAEGSGATQERRLAALQPVAGEPPLGSTVCLCLRYHITGQRREPPQRNCFTANMRGTYPFRDELSRKTALLRFASQTNYGYCLKKFEHRQKRSLHPKLCKSVAEVPPLKQVCQEAKS